ncbi:hypothetical protein GCM10020218_005460 [Dactylosporangium vinaceum]
MQSDDTGHARFRASLDRGRRVTWTIAASARPGSTRRHGGPQRGQVGAAAVRPQVQAITLHGEERWITA